MLEEASEPKEETDLVKKLLDENQTKKSFEMKIENDDDDEIFIVHEEGDENQNDLFVDGAGFQDFGDAENEKKEIKNVEGTETSPTIENPFVDNLANSENLPVTQKLDVKINDDYLA